MIPLQKSQMFLDAENGCKIAVCENCTRLFTSSFTLNSWHCPHFEYVHFYFRFWQWIFLEKQYKFAPIKILLLISSVQPFIDQASNFVDEIAECSAVSCYTIVVAVPLQFVNHLLYIKLSA